MSTFFWANLVYPFIILKRQYRVCVCVCVCVMKDRIMLGKTSYDAFFGQNIKLVKPFD
jgi:hypothetical protein